MLNCATCTLSQHHCCKASISYNIMEVMDLVEKAKKINIDVKVLPSREKPNYFNIVKRGRPVRLINDENCVFLKEGKCQIYDERPSICRVYGTDIVKCWFNNLPFDTPVEELFDMSKERITILTQEVIASNEQEVIQFFNNAMRP